MLTYLAANGHGSSGLGWAGISTAAAAALAGCVAVIQLGTFRLFQRSRDAEELAKNVDEKVANQEKQIQFLHQYRDHTARSIRELQSGEGDPSPAEIASNEQVTEQEPQVGVQPASPRDLAIQHIIDVNQAVNRELIIAQDANARLTQIRAESHMNQISALFRHARIAFYCFLFVSLISSGVLLYGAYLAIYGHIASGVIVSLSSAVPGGFSAGLYRISRSANKQSDDALDMLNREVERETQIGRMLNPANVVNDGDTQEAIRTLAALRAAFPDASPKELSSLLSAVRDKPTSKKSKLP
jgi:hypothetical protein